ncbi:hypothetical protein ACFWZ3_15645 [Frateuria sp. GZRR35]|uniref:hypothetical protein n=1 Tax=unclassified Frateuria TaxID=2648894 RepID=UPI003EDB6D8B
MEGAFQYLVFYFPDLAVVPVSLFFSVGEHGEVRGLYFGDAGGGTFDEAYFRMDAPGNDSRSFLECENPEDVAFNRDRVNARRRKAIALSPDDARVFEELRTYRGTWWTFDDGDSVLMRPVRLKEMQKIDAGPGEGKHQPRLLFARSGVLDTTLVDRVREHWSLRGL